MGIMVYSLLWVMQDFDHQPYYVFWGTQKRAYFRELPREG